MDLDLLKKKRYNLHTVSREKNKHIFLSNSNSSSPSSTSPINTPIVTFHRDKCPANCTTKTRKQRLRASERSRSGHRDRWEKKKRKTGRKEGEREEKRKRKPIVVAIKREENAEKRKREREEFPSVAVDEQQPRLEGEGTVEMALGRGGRRGWKRGYRGFILIPAGA